jgi:predicted TIM-barrel fold metal-dependent hydrolase
VSALDDAFRPWFDRLLQETGPLDLYDAHTHIGQNDPDGFSQTPDELVEGLTSAGARGVVFPMHEPDGYPAANDAAIAAAVAHPDRLVAFCRIDPRNGAVAEARRALDAGARGIKLHPRAERFGMDEPVVRDIVALADERRVPILIHAGRGIPALGRITVELAEAFPGASLILAHAAISDLAWLWRVLPSHPNVLVDTAWWHPSDLLALFALAPPANIVWASDSPYGRPLIAAAVGLRCALQAGLEPAQLRGIAGETLARVLGGEAPQDLGPPPGEPSAPLDLLLERVVAHLGGAFARMAGGGDPVEPLGLARLACAG